MAAVKGSTALPDKAFPTSPALAQLLPAEAVLDALKMMLIGASLNEVLTSVTHLIEAHREGMMCSILLLDEDGLHLRYGVAANMTDGYRAVTEGVCIGPNVGSCGAAAYLRQPVFISDMQSIRKHSRSTPSQSSLASSLRPNIRMLCAETLIRSVEEQLPIDRRAVKK